MIRSTESGAASGVRSLRWQLRMLRCGKWSVYYDGNCAFCRRWVERARKLTLRRVQWRDFRKHGREVEPLQPRFDEAAYLIIDNRLALPGFRAFRNLLFAMPIFWPFLPLFYAPGAAPLGNAVYRYISIRYGPAGPQPSCAAKTAGN
jgi:predicted DCC family thiol-disulfide oxidoreductase YuxK